MPPISRSLPSSAIGPGPDCEFVHRHVRSRPGTPVPPRTASVTFTTNDRGRSRRSMSASQATAQPSVLSVIDLSNRPALRGAVRVWCGCTLPVVGKNSGSSNGSTRDERKNRRAALQAEDGSEEPSLLSARRRAAQSGALRRVGAGPSHPAWSSIRPISPPGSASAACCASRRTTPARSMR